MQYQHPKTKFERFTYRFFEVLPGAISWATIILGVVFSFLAPVVLAIFIIAFDVYWMIKAIYISIYMIASYRRLKLAEEVDWIGEVRKIPDWTRIYHLVILPFYGEGIDIIRPTLRAIADSSYPNEKMIIVLAAEEREGNSAIHKIAQAKKEFAGKFFKFIATVHPDGVAGEIAGKASNEAWAGKQAQKLIDKLEIPHEDVIATVFDIDTIAHPEYFSNLTYHYLTHPNPTRSSYQPVPVYHNNIWQAPFLMRLVANTTSFWQLIEQSRPERLVTFSSHSMSFKALVEMGFWETDVVSEDSRVFWQAYLFFDGEYEVTPMFLPVSMDTLLDTTYRKTMSNQYKQVRRWAWGVENFPYLVFGFLKNNRISFWDKIAYTFRQFEGMYTWATSARVLSL